MTTQIEKLLPPKEISEALERDHGLKLSPDYIRAIRREAIRRGDRLFVAGMARPSAVFIWLEGNPHFQPFRSGVPAIS